MSVKAVTPSAAAASPLHPDHARWVKERTLGMEARHAAETGGTLRQAEDANRRALERLAKRPQRAVAKPAARKPLTREETKASGVTRKLAAPKQDKVHKVSARDAKWAVRVSQIMDLGRKGDRRAHSLAMEVVAIKIAMSARRDYKDAIGRELPFSRLKGASLERAVRAGMEWVCDRSVSLLGAWR